MSNYDPFRPFEHAIAAPGSRRSEANFRTKGSSIGAPSAAGLGLQWTHFALTIAYASSKVDPERTAPSKVATPVGPEHDKNFLTSWPAAVYTTCKLPGTSPAVSPYFLTA